MTAPAGLRLPRHDGLRAALMGARVARRMGMPRVRIGYRMRAKAILRTLRAAQEAEEALMERGGVK